MHPVHISLINESKSEVEAKGKRKGV